MAAVTITSAMEEVRRSQTNTGFWFRGQRSCPVWKTEVKWWNGTQHNSNYVTCDSLQKEKKSEDPNARTQKVSNNNEAVVKNLKSKMWATKLTKQTEANLQKHKQKQETKRGTKTKSRENITDRNPEAWGQITRAAMQRLGQNWWTDKVLNTQEANQGQVKLIWTITREGKPEEDRQ